MVSKGKRWETEIGNMKLTRNDIHVYIGYQVSLDKRKRRDQFKRFISVKRNEILTNTYIIKLSNSRLQQFIRHRILHGHYTRRSDWIDGAKSNSRFDKHDRHYRYV